MKKSPPSPEALRVARSALNIPKDCSDKAVLYRAGRVLGLRRLSDYPNSRTRLLLEAAKMV